MQKKLIQGAALIFVVVIVFLFAKEMLGGPRITGAPPFGERLEDVPVLGSYEFMRNWERPDGPARVGLQVGHWKNEELPEELEKLIGNTGATGGGRSEWEVNFGIARAAAAELRAAGIEVDILPATVPVEYWADVFVAVHADGSTDTTKSGFKVAAPWRDMSRSAEDLSGFVEREYEEATGMAIDKNVTRNMRGYYAFSWWRYQHAIHPMTTAVIIETGFLTNAQDRKVIVGNPETAGGAIAEGIIAYLNSEGLL